MPTTKSEWRIKQRRRSQPQLHWAVSATGLSSSPASCVFDAGAAACSAGGDGEGPAAGLLLLVRCPAEAAEAGFWVT
jgi:hypothetical protein